MLKRISTGVILIPIIIAIVYWAPPWIVTVIAAAIALAGILEFFRLTSKMGMRGFTNWTMLCTAGIFWVQWLAGAAEPHFLSDSTALVQNAPPSYASNSVILLAFLFGVAFLGTMSRMPLADVLPGLSASSGALLFVALPFSFLARMDARPDSGHVLVLFALGIVWAGDTVAYFVGKSMGRVKMAPALSPKKTWEGAAGNMLGSLIVGAGFATWQNGDWSAWLVTAALANVAGQAGDLLESAYKRGAGVKDSGAALPGHGGILDRIDSLILAAPVVWLAAEWLMKGRP